MGHPVNDNQGVNFVQMKTLEKSADRFYERFNHKIPGLLTADKDDNGNGLKSEMSLTFSEKTASAVLKLQLATMSQNRLVESSFQDHMKSLLVWYGGIQ